ncbi:hypothetical protein OCA8868_01767 [Octadecabacter ascidiaceicola]|uniref:Uncharacterized protein n=1 Tax=Octadecabacter ascidiaceicola TaxID=1655543 RepID=A0A238K5T7_9RHOB|nr:hypothetical protein OCA8868_01767 [Octadecabacter ascidiaceicola]
MYRLLFASDFSHVLGNHSYVSGLLIDTRVVAFLELRSHRDLISGQVGYDLMGLRFWGCSFPLHAFDLSRTPLGCFGLDADSNLISPGVERRFASQYIPSHTRQFIGESGGGLVSMHAL